MNWASNTKYHPGETGSPFIKKEYYRIDIQYLRAFSVISVLVFHAWPNWIFKSGYLGVDIFFVISGFVITLDLKRRIDKNTRIIEFLFDFYTRRARRIFPSIIVLLIFVQIFFQYSFSENILIFFQKQIVAASLFFSNIFYFFNFGYFKNSSDRIALLHFWSLAIEEQFYILFPMVIFYTRKKNIFLYFLIFIIIFSISCIPFISENANFYFNRAWQLAIGAALTIVPARKISEQSRLIASLALIILMSATVTFDFRGYHLVYLGNVTIVILTSLAILMRLPVINFTGLSLIMEKIGAISFPLYLWHWPIIVALNLITDGVYRWYAPIFAIILAFMLAYISDKFVETPIRLRKTNIKLPWSAAAILFSIGGLALAFPNTAIRYGTPSQLEMDLLGFDDARNKIPKCAFKNLPKGLSWCFQTGSNAQYALIGDSHADHLFVGINTDDSADWLFMGRNSCPPIASRQGKAPYLKYEGNFEFCRQATDNMINAIVSNKSIHTVGISFLSPYYFSAPYAKQHRQIANLQGYLSKAEIGLAKPALLESVAEGLRNTILHLQEAGKKVVLIEDIPELPFSPDACLNRWKFSETLKECGVPREENRQRTKVYRELLHSLKLQFPELRIVQTDGIFCDETFCSPIQDGRMLYRDSHHLSLIGSAVVARKLLKEIHNVPE